MSRPLLILSLLALSGMSAAPAPEAVSLLRFEEICDASTAVAIGSDRFLVSNDEKNKLWVYRLGQPKPAQEEIDIKDHLALVGEKKEADIEGSAMLNGTLYWITSHGRKKSGELDANRYRFFALTPRVVDDKVVVAPTGKPFTHLMEDMLAVPALASLGLSPLDPGLQKDLAPEAPKGTNIEGLAAWKGDQLLIAFRNPIPDGKALLIPLENPAGVLLADEKARFGAPLRLDLGGLGVRSIEYWPERGQYVIVAGGRDDSPDFRLYLWSGNPASAPKPVAAAGLSGLRPEALVIYPGRRNEVLLLSDDGGILVDGVECKELDKKQRSFRARWVALPAATSR